MPPRLLRLHHFCDLDARSLVPVCAAAKAESGLSSKLSARRVGLATLLVIAGSLGLHQAKAVGSGDTRTLSFHHVHTGEDLTITFKKNGQYDEGALQKINWIMRDWRKNEATKMDPQEIDLLWEVYRDVGAKEPIHIICGYRSPDTNSMLRRRSKGVAKFSQHTLGKAIDFFIPGVPLDVLRAAAMKAQGGGVGFYPTSGSPFVHLDIGNVRAWPRMTREQLVKLFPDGRTVHLPTDGTPLPGYQLALADLERGHRSAAAPQKRSLLAALFGRDKDVEEADDTASARQPSPAPSPAPRSASAKVAASPAAPAPAPAAPAAPARTMVLAAAAPEPAAETTPIPLPPRRPIYQIASADSRSVPAPALRAAAPINLASLSPNDIINMRGLWDGFQQATDGSSSEAINMSSARRALASSLAGGRDVTAAIKPIAGADRVPAETALAYAAPVVSDMSAERMPQVVPTVVTNKGGASIAEKPDGVTTGRFARAVDKFDDPWLRGLMLVSSVQGSLVVTRVGDADVTSLTQHMQKPASAVVMTFSADPYFGMTTEAFTGSAVVFQATMSFNAGPRRTAALR
jgi:uncharacterized protein YcbK (DUF882 family)